MHIYKPYNTYERSVDMEKRWSGRLPKAVHYQCTWIIKDLDRLYRLDAMRRHGKREDEMVLFEDENCKVIRPEVMDLASHRLACIKEALEIVPEEYRTDTIESIADGSMPTSIAHENTWKRWRRLFIKELAYKLNLI